MHFNNAHAITVDNVQQVVNIILDKQLVTLFVIILIDAK